MLRIPAFQMQIDAPADCGLAEGDSVFLYGPTDGKFGVGITPPQPGDDPAGDLEDKYALMAALGPVGDKGATYLNRHDPAMPFIGAIRNPHTSQLYLLIPYNHAGLKENDLRKELSRIVACIGFISPAMAQWDATLRGRKFTEAESYQRQLGSGDGYSRQEDLTFQADGMYERRITGHTSISGGGLSLGSVRDEREVGSWDVVESNGAVVLRMDDQGGGRSELSLARTARGIRLGDREFVRTA
jgi:hypothetical protein